LPHQWHPLFDLWATIALAVTKANSGSVIHKTDIYFEIGESAEKAILSGRIVGALEELADEDPEAPPQIRFNNHRAQEFFAAYAIARARAPFDWTNKLDVPRWQETLVNVSQMNAANDAIPTVVDRLAGSTLVYSGSGGGLEVRAVADAAERVDLAARVMRELPPSEQRDKLKEKLRAAVSAQINAADGFSVASALRSIQQSPEIGDLELIAPALESPSGWVRDQAFVVASTLPGANTAQIGLREVALSFAENRLFQRLPRYLGLARRLRSSKLGLVSLGGAGLFAGALLGANAIGVLILVTLLNADNTWAPAALLPVISSLQQVKIVVLITIVGCGVMATAWSYYKKSDVLLYPIFAGFLSNYIIVWCLSLWIYAPELRFVSLVAGSLRFFFGLMLTMMLCLCFSGLIIGSTAILFAVLIALASRSTEMFASTIRLVFNKNEHYEIVMPATFISASFICYLLTIALFSQKHTEAVYTLLEPWKYIIISADVVIIVVIGHRLSLRFISFFKWTVKSSLLEKLQAAKTTMLSLGGGIIGGIMYLSAFAVFFVAAIVLDQYFQHASLLAYALLGVTAVAMIIMAGIVGRAFYVSLLERLNPANLDPVKWAARVREAGPNEQARLIRSAHPGRFHLEVETTIDLIVDLRSAVYTEPALSAFDAKLSELLMLRRQRRAD
jgi:hypothetical protein